MAARTRVRQGVRGWVVLMHLPMLRMCVARVAARATAVLDVCVLPPHRCVSVAVVMSSAVRSMRIDALGGAPNAATVTARLLAGGAR